jgi:hypothetical protein
LFSGQASSGGLSVLNGEVGVSRPPASAVSRIEASQLPLSLCVYKAGAAGVDLHPRAIRAYETSQCYGY